MKCLACSRDLTPKTAGGLTVDACEGGCGGIWFDQLELRKVDDQEEAAGEALLDISRDPAVRVDYDQQWACPACPDTLMMRHFYSPRRQVEIDECARCGGVWLDAGELATIRSQYASEDQRRAAAHQVFKDLYDETLAAEEAEQQAMTERARRFAHLFRFICPSYYIPGDQPWGAF